MAPAAVSSLRHALAFVVKSKDGAGGMNPLDWDLGNVPPGIAWGGVDGGTRSARAEPEREHRPVDGAIAGGQGFSTPAQRGRA